MSARLTYLLTPILALAFAAGCVPREHHWPSEVTKSAAAATVQHGDDTITIVAHTEGNDGAPVSPTEWGYNAALLRAARETEVAGFSRFEVIKSETYVISDVINHVGAPQRVRYTMTINPLAPDEHVGNSRRLHQTADVIAGPVGGYL